MEKWRDLKATARAAVDAAKDADVDSTRREVDKLRASAGRAPSPPDPAVVTLGSVADGRLEAVEAIRQIARAEKEQDVLAAIDAAWPRPLEPSTKWAEAKVPEPVLWGDDEDAGTILREGDVAILTGAGNVGKSYLSLAIARATAAVAAEEKEKEEERGVVVLGFGLRPGPVVMINYEDDPATMANRLKGIALMDHSTGLPPDLHIAPNPYPLWGGDPENQGRSAESDWWSPLWEAVHAVQPSLVVIDPVSAALASVNQNDGGSVRAFVQALMREGRKGGFGILLVAHPPKSGRFDAAQARGAAGGAAAIMGSAQWWDAARGVLFASSWGTDGLAVEAAKANHGPTRWALTLKKRMAGRRFLGWAEPRTFSPAEWEQQLAIAAKGDKAKGGDKQQKTTPDPCLIHGNEDPRQHMDNCGACMRLSYGE